MYKEPFFLSREALYIKVWETPTIKLAKEFGVSDVAIGKMCKRLDVPKPSLGYWRRVETGQKKKIPPLGKPSEKTKLGVWIYPKSEERTLEFAEEYKEQNLIAEQKIAEKLNEINFPKIKVSSTLYKPHPLIEKTKNAFSKKETDVYGALCGSWQEEHLNLRVSRKHFNRALQIMDALIKALEKLGGKVSIVSDRQMLTEIKLEETKLSISLREDFKRFERELSAEEKKSRYASDRYYYEPTGNFSITVEGVYNIHGSWRDKETIRLEDNLNAIILGVFRIVEECRQKEIERKNEERRQIENAIQYEKRKIIQKKELECRNFLENLSAQWRKSRDLLNFLQEFEAKLIEEKGELSPDSDEARLLEWAYSHAAQLNPILNDQRNELLKQFKTRSNEPKEDDSYEYSNLLWKLRLLK